MNNKLGHAVEVVVGGAATVGIGILVLAGLREVANAAMAPDNAAMKDRVVACQNDPDYEAGKVYARGELPEKCKRLGSFFIPRPDLDLAQAKREHRSNNKLPVRLRHLQAPTDAQMQRKLEEWKRNNKLF